MRKVVVLPQPLGPKSVTNELSAISRLRSDTAAGASSPAAKLLVRFLREMLAINSPTRAVRSLPLKGGGSGWGSLRCACSSAASAATARPPSCFHVSTDQSRPQRAPLTPTPTLPLSGGGGRPPELHQVRTQSRRQPLTCARAARDATAA